MSTVVETKKRIDIARSIADAVAPYVYSVVVGGSVGFGANYSVTEKSDIDMVVVCRSDQARHVCGMSVFGNRTPAMVLGLFEQGTIGMFWVPQIINSIKVNTFFYRPHSYSHFSTGKGGIVAYKPTRPTSIRKAYLFDGSAVHLDLNVRTFGDGYLYDRPCLANGHYYGGVPRHDFLIQSLVLHQTDSYFDSLRERVWTEAIRRLRVEHGENPDTDRFSILNTLYAYSATPEKVPPSVAEAIRQETQRRLQVS